MAIATTALLSLGSQLIGKFISDPEQKAKAELDLVKAHQNGEFKELEVRMEAIVAEATSNDPWTSRARPSFLYLVYFLILVLAVFAPLVGVWFPEHMELYFTNVNKGLQAIPEPMWWLFGSVMLGYTTARSLEKRMGVAK